MVAMVSALQRGEESAFTDIYDTFYNDVYYHILKTIKDPELAADLTQDTFMEILETIGKLEEPAAFVTWAKQIAYHRCTAHFRKRHELLADESEDGYSVFDALEEDRAEFIPDEALNQQDFKKTILDMIDSLPPEQRSALLMRYYEELSVKEIAKIQGVSEGTVKSRLNYGRKAVKESVEEYEKKNDIKLHCAGVVPLLLWLFWQVRKLGLPISSTSAGTAAASTAAASGAAAAAVGATVSGKGIASATVAKLFACIAAVIIVIGSILFTTRSCSESNPGATSPSDYSSQTPKPNFKPNNDPTTEPTDPAVFSLSQLPRQWVGYGTDNLLAVRRLELTFETLTDTQIAGTFQIIYLHEIQYTTAFTGVLTEGIEEGLYLQLTYEGPSYPDGYYNEFSNSVDLYYNPQENALRYTADLGYIYMIPTDKEQVTVAEPGIWSGEGDNDYSSELGRNYFFEIKIYIATDMEIHGRLTVTNNGGVVHSSPFTGYGYQSSQKYHYQILFEVPFSGKSTFHEYTISAVRLDYDTTDNTFHFDGPAYEADMTVQ